MWIPKDAALIRGWRLFEVRRLLEETRHLIYSGARKPFRKIMQHKGI